MAMRGEGYVGLKGTLDYDSRSRLDITGWGLGALQEGGRPLRGRLARYAMKWLGVGLFCKV